MIGKSGVPWRGTMNNQAGAWPNIRFDYRGSDVLVTGATSGIGLAIARAYGDAGAQVTITGRKSEASGYGVDLSGFRYLQLDVTHEADVDRLAAQISKLDVLINNAGIGWVGGGMGEREYEQETFEL